MATQKVSKAKRGKRRWYSIIAPKVFNEQEIGQSFVYGAEFLEGKNLTINLMQLTGNPSKQNMSVFFKVNKVHENKGLTKVTGIEMHMNSMRRLVRRGRSKIADSFLAKTKSGDIIRIKPVVMTRTRVTGDTQKKVRAKAKEILREVIGKHSFETIVNDIVNQRLQKHLKQELQTLAPVRSADIRSFRFARVISSEDAEEEIEETQYFQVQPRKTSKKSELASLKEELLADDEDDDFDDEDDEDFDDDDDLGPSEEEVVASASSDDDEEKEK